MTDPVVSKKLRLAVVGTYPPRRCGIATFTQDVADAVCRASGDPRTCKVIALDDIPQGYDYPDRVRFQIRQEDPASYRLAADFMNIRGVDALVVQHEYGIFGGRDGAHVLTLLHEARMPIITTMHTVLAQASDHMHDLTGELIRLSDRVVVLCHRGVEMLQEVYAAPAEKIVMIPHGIPDLPCVEPSFYKDRFGVENRKVLLTFGLISPAKGFEHMIRALPPLVEKHPELVYIILGATHPHVKRERGEEYRHGLQRLAEELGVWDHVVFEDRYVDIEELCEFLGAADIYVTPYLGEGQIVSGTLAYALGAGKAVVSTPYSYAKEMLADGRGRLVPFRDSEALAREIGALLENEAECQAMRKRAYMFTRDMVWDCVGQRFLQLAEEVVRQRSQSGRVLARPVSQPATIQRTVPELDLRYLRVLTDDTGIFQHGIFTIPNRWHGYCTDDNARALGFALMAYEQTRRPELLDMARTYMSFLHYAFNVEKGRFRNFLSYDRQWLEDVGSDDAQGRAMAALGYTVAVSPVPGLRTVAVELFDRAMRIATELRSPRAIADTLIGIHAYLRRYSGDASARRIREELAVRLFTGFCENATDDWPWPEPMLAYANGKLPQALLLAGQWLQRGDMIEQGLRTLDWLMRIQTGPNGEFAPVGNHGWYPRGGEKACFDQQPIEAHTMLEACLQARNLTSDDRWAGEARRAFNWFLGKNSLGLPVYDYQTGGCRDGLLADGANQNEGAESTLSWLTSLLAIKSLKPIHEELPLESQATLLGAG
jgi:glycosyltransferase involved in cell wall biosynthesis